MGRKLTAVQVDGPLATTGVLSPAEAGVAAVAATGTTCVALCGLQAASKIPVKAVRMIVFLKFNLSYLSIRMAIERVEFPAIP